MTRQTVVIALRGLEVDAVHGVFDFERQEPQRFVADVTLWVQADGALAADDIAGTVSYAEIADEVVSILQGQSASLLETLADRIARAAMSYDGVEGVEATVHKPDAPMPHAFDDVSVTVRLGAVDLTPLALTRADIYDAGAGSVLTGSTGTGGASEGGKHGQADGRRAALPSPVVVGPRSVVIAIGGNLGNVPVTLASVVEALDYVEGFSVSDVSPLLRTRPVLDKEQQEQPDYWNAVVLGTFEGDVSSLLEQTERIEREFGRERNEHWGARTIDIDIVQVEGTTSSDPALMLPHPRAHERAFVLAPWVLADPSAVLEGVGPVAELLEECDDREGILDAIDDWLEDPEGIIEESDEVLAASARDEADGPAGPEGPQRQSGARSTAPGAGESLDETVIRPLQIPLPAQAPAARSPQADGPSPEREPVRAPGRPRTAAVARAGVPRLATIRPMPAPPVGEGGDQAVWDSLWARWASTEVGEDIAEAMGIERPAPAKTSPAAAAPAPATGGAAAPAPAAGAPTAPAPAAGAPTAPAPVPAVPEPPAPEDEAPAAPPSIPPRLPGSITRPSLASKGVGEPPAPGADAASGEGDRRSQQGQPPQQGQAPHQGGQQDPRKGGAKPRRSKPQRGFTGTPITRPDGGKGAPARPAWHPVSSVPANSPSGRTPVRTKARPPKAQAAAAQQGKPSWSSLFGDVSAEENHPGQETSTQLAPVPREVGREGGMSLPDWQFSLAGSEQVRVVDDRSQGPGPERGQMAGEADQRRAILEPNLPKGTPMGPIPADEATHTGILRRVVVRPTMTGAIPIVKPGRRP